MLLFEHSQNLKTQKQRSVYGWSAARLFVIFAISATVYILNCILYSLSLYRIGLDHSEYALIALVLFLLSACINPIVYTFTTGMVRNNTPRVCMISCTKT